MCANAAESLPAKANARRHVVHAAVPCNKRRKNNNIKVK
jgi:hypothetical protein